MSVWLVLAVGGLLVGCREASAPETPEPEPEPETATAQVDDPAALPEVRYYLLSDA